MIKKNNFYLKTFGILIIVFYMSYPIFEYYNGIEIALLTKVTFISNFIFFIFSWTIGVKSAIIILVITQLILILGYSKLVDKSVKNTNN